MRKLISTAVFIAIVSACSTNDVKILTSSVADGSGSIATIKVSNPSTFNRPDTVIKLSLNRLGVAANTELQAWLNGDSLPTQMVDDDGDNQFDSLVFSVNLEAADRLEIDINQHLVKTAIRQRTQAEVSTKKGGGWQEGKYVGGTFENVTSVTPPPQYTDHGEYIRYEGPGIESDRVGYRVYLDWRNGFDIFGKKTKKMVLQDIGKDGYDSYHKMADWGADILKVGSSLGAGGFGFWNGDAVEPVAKVAQRSATVSVNGPLYSALNIDYQDWDTGVANVDLNTHLSMRAGSSMVDVELRTSEALSNIAIGLVQHPDSELILGDLEITGEAWSYVASFGKQSLFDDNLGMVLMFKKRDFIEQTSDENSYIVLLKPRGTSLQYAFGASWAGHPSEAQTRDEFVAQIEQEIERRSLAPRLSINSKSSDSLAQQSPLKISASLAKSEVERRGDSLIYGNFDNVRDRRTQWTYTTGLLMQALDDLSELNGEQYLTDYSTKVMDSYLGTDQAIKGYVATKYNIDDINSGKMIQRLYARTGDAKYRSAIDVLAASLEEHPRTSEGALWHKQKYPHQLWLDGVYMGMPFLAGVGLMQNDEHKLEEAVKEFVIARSHLRDPDTGLYFHAWDEAKQQVWADPETGRSAYVWGRGLGWYAMALVDILDVIPSNRKELRQPLLDIIPELADSLLQTQHSSGAWFQIMDMPNATGNYLEASGTSMFTYFLAKAIDQGYLSNEYRTATLKAYQGLVSEFVTIDANGNYHLNNICEVAGLGFGRDGSYHYYMSERLVSNDPKGLAPAIMAGVQLAKLLNINE